MSIDYSNVENGLSKSDKNGFFPRNFFAYEKIVILVANRSKTRVS
jgi:hypothetical protein